MPRAHRSTGARAVRWAAAIGLLALIGAAAPAAESLRVPVGQSVAVPLGAPVAKISEADASVVGYFLNAPDQIEIVGRGTGRSPLRVRLADGSARLFQVDVVSPDAAIAASDAMVVVPVGEAPRSVTPAASTAPLADASWSTSSSAGGAWDLTLGVGESQSFDVTGEATRIDVGSPGVIEVQRNQPGDVTLIGRAPGETNLTLTGSGGAVSRYRVRVHASTPRVASLAASGDGSDLLTVTEVPPAEGPAAQSELPVPPPEAEPELPMPPAYPPEANIGPMPTNLEAAPADLPTAEHIGELQKSIDQLRGQIAAQQKPAPTPPPPPVVTVPPAEIKQAVREALRENSADESARVWRPSPRTPAPVPPPPATLDVQRDARAAAIVAPPTPVAPPAAPRPAPPAPGAPELRPIVRLADLKDATLSLGVGRSRVLLLESAAKRVAIANPAVGDVVLATPSQLVINGRSSGTTDLVIWDQADRGSQIRLRVEAQGTNEKQVLLKCKVAEVKRQAMRELGIDMAVLLDSNVVNGGLEVVTQSGGVLPGALPGLAGGNVLGSDGKLPTGSDLTIFQPDRGIFAFIQALEQRGIARILAEPNLVAINGQQASFLAGGEVPIPMVTSLQTGELPRVTVEFKEFGVKLNFLPTILDDDTISLHVSPEVSSLDFTNGVVLSDFKIPAIDTRKAETTVQLHDGQSIVIAGLMMTKRETGESKVPWLGDVPVLGYFFRSDSVKSEETELVILLTARIVRPLPAGSAPSLPFDRVANR